MKNLYILKTAIPFISSFRRSKPVFLLTVLLFCFCTSLYGQRLKPRLMKYSFITGSKRVSFSANMISNSFLNLSFKNNESNNVNSFTGFDFSMAYSKILLNHRIVEFNAQYSFVEHDLYSLKTYAVGTDYGKNLLNYRSMLFLNVYGGIPFGYAHFHEYDTGKYFDYFSFAAKATLEAELYLTNFFIVSARIAPVFNVYNLEFYRFYYSYGLSAKISF